MAVLEKMPQRSVAFESKLPAAQPRALPKSVLKPALSIFLKIAKSAFSLSFLQWLESLYKFFPLVKNGATIGPHEQQTKNGGVNLRPRKQFEVFNQNGLLI